MLYYRDNSDLIITESIINSYGSYLISKDKRKEFVNALDSITREEIAKSNLRVKYEVGDYTFAKEVVDKATLYANLLVCLGYRQCLFVPHFKAGYQLNWIEKKDNKLHTNFDVLFQYIPVIMKNWHRTKISVVNSEEQRFNFIMNGVYRNYPIHSYNSVKQYEFGNTVWFKNPPRRKYDAIIFLGMPNKEEYSYEQLRKDWEPYGKPGYDLVHMKDGGSQFQMNSFDISNEIEVVFRHRKDCDVQSRGKNSAEDIKKMTESVSVF